MGRPKGSKNKPKTDSSGVKLEAPKKRGRPASSKNTSAMKVEAPKITKRTRKPKTPVVVSDTVNEVDDGPVYNYLDNYLNPFEDTGHSFECRFEETYEWGNIIPPKADAKKRLGNYSSCRVPVKPVSKTLYPIVAYIQADIETLRSQGYSDRDIYAGCVNYLNRNQSKSKLKRFGNLMPYYFKVLESGKISAMFLTDEKKSKMFWGEGE
jgi:hypothetical protein